MNRNASLSRDGILEQILAAKRLEVAALRSGRAALRRRAESAGPVADFVAAVSAGQALGVVAEVKRRSPAAGAIRDVVAADTARAYVHAGASAVSVLTDREFFGGSLQDLIAVAASVSVPVLRKDFTIDELQIVEARAAGAAAVLLIVRALDDARLRGFRELAAGLGMAAVVEVHDEEELERALTSGAGIIGINNRDLTTFETDLRVTERLAPLAHGAAAVVSESGIRTADDAARVAAAGASAVLVGEALMRARDPGQLLASFAAIRRSSIR